jgi:hypothetical protein
LGRFGAAAQEYRETLRLSPGYAEARRELVTMADRTRR